jgi:serine-type D-Ala-D-Ala carboxypeptidase
MEPASNPTRPPTDAHFEPALRVLRDAIRDRIFPGCAFGVLAKNDVVLQGALGRFTYEPDAPLVQPDTVFDVASLTKIVATTAAAMLLHQRGQLDLETPLGELLPGFIVGRAPEEHARKVTLRHLLAHNSGLPGYVEFFRTAATPAALYRACLTLPIEAEPGTHAEYSDPGFILLGKALEVLTGEYLAPWVRREILTPLGMNETAFCPASAQRSTIPPTEEDTGFRHRRIQGEVQDENAYILKGAAGHAGLFSNVPDLLRFSSEMMTNPSSSQSAHQPSPLFDPATIDLFSRKQDPPTSSRALGWDTPSHPSSSGVHFSPRSIGQLGYSGCSLWIDRDADIAITLLTNRTWPDRPASSAEGIRRVRPAFHDAVRVLME